MINPSDLFSLLIDPGEEGAVSYEPATPIRSPDIDDEEVDDPRGFYTD